MHSNVTATFSESVFPGTISFVLKNGSTTVPSAVTYDVASHTVTLDPNSNLAPGTTYTATLSGAQDVSGNTMTLTSWSFTTVALSTTAPAVSSQTPVSGATGVLLASNVTATFSESVIPSTVSFVLKNGTTTVASAVTYDSASHTVTLDPTANLGGRVARPTRPRSPGAQDIWGNTMTSTSWSFTTVAADVAPTVSAQSPASSLATGVPIASNVTAVFSESIITSTIEASCSRATRRHGGFGNKLRPGQPHGNARSHCQPRARNHLHGNLERRPGPCRSNAMSSTSWSLTTSVANTTAPTVSARTPVSGATGVPIASNVTATFSEAVQAGTISFVLKNGSTTVSSTVSYDPASKTVFLDPTASLAPGTTYTATLSGAQDLCLLTQ